MTDAVHSGEDRDALAAALSRLAGRVTCDARGFGTDWTVSELRGIAHALEGTLDIVAGPDDLAAEMRSMVDAAMAKVVSGLALRIRVEDGARLTLIRQHLPLFRELNDVARGDGEDGGLAPEFACGTWGNESREFFLHLDVPPAAGGEARDVAHVEVVAPRGDGTDDVLCSTPIHVVWQGEDEREPASVPVGSLPILGDFEGRCHYCGEPVLAGDRFCEMCGADLHARRIGAG